MTATGSSQAERDQVMAGQGEPGRSSRAAAAMTGLRRHWLAAGLLAAGLVLRVLALLAYRPALFYIDTERYLYNNPPGMDPLGYGGVVRALSPVAGFAGVVVFQHLLGLAMAVAIYVLLLCRGVPRWLAALAMAPVLLDAYQLQIEQNIMPDAVFEALIVAGIAILLWRPAATWRRAAAAGLVLGASATVAQVGEALLLPAVIFLLVVAGGGWLRTVGRAAVLAVAFVVPVAAYMTGSYVATGSFFLSHTGVTSFYGRTASAADCATLKLSPSLRGMCPARAQQAQGPDWLEYSAGSPIRRYYSNPDRAQTDSQISAFNHAVLTQQPGRLLSAYGRDVAKLFALTRASDPGDTPLSRWQFQDSFPYFPGPPGQSWSSRAQVHKEIAQFGGSAPAVWRPVAAFLRSYQLDGGYTPGPLLGLCALAGLIGSVLAFRRKAAAAARQQALACLLFFGSAVFLLGVSDLFEFSWRYQLPALVTLVPAGALGLSVMIRSAQSRRDRART
jgi:hypothetical protein